MSTSTTTFPAFTYQATARRLESALGDELIVLGQVSAQYFVMNAAGSFLWQQLHTPRTAGQLVQALVDEFEVDHDDATRDVADLLERLESLDLLTVTRAR